MNPKEFLDKRRFVLLGALTAVTVDGDMGASDVLDELKAVLADIDDQKGRPIKIIDADELKRLRAEINCAFDSLSRS